MSFKAILHLSGQNIVLDYVDLELNQSVDARSRPASMTRGGTITVEFDTPSDGDMIADWAANPVKQLDGSITYMNQNQDSVMKTVNFYNAYCIEFMERFDGTMSSSNMKTTIKISPERVNIGGVEHDNNWFVHGTSKGAGAKATTVSSGIASKEGTEFEKGTVVESKLQKSSQNESKSKGVTNQEAKGIPDNQPYFSAEAVPLKTESTLKGQRDGFTCLPTSLDMVLRDMGHELPSYYIEGALKFDDGAYLKDVPDALIDLGIGNKAEFSKTRTISEIEAALKEGKSVIASVNDGKGTHAIVIDKIENGNVIIRDPLPVNHGSVYSIPVEVFSKSNNGSVIISK